MLKIFVVAIVTLFTSSAHAQQGGSFTLNASLPDPATFDTGCLILGQLTVSSSQTVIQASTPICPSTAGDYASSPLTGVNISWPLTTDGDSTSSLMAIYGGVLHVSGNEDPDPTQTNPYQAKAACVMELTVDQVEYLFGRSLTWNNGLEELWDNMGNGFIMNGTNGSAITCETSSPLLPSDLWLNCPYMYKASDETWQVPIAIPASNTSTSTSTSTSSTISTATSQSITVSTSSPTTLNAATTAVDVESTSSPTKTGKCKAVTITQIQPTTTSGSRRRGHRGGQ